MTLRLVHAAPETEATLEPLRPLVEVGADLSATIDQAMSALATDPSLYQRSDELVRVLPGEDGALRMLPHGAGSLRATMARVAVWARQTPKGPQATTPPTDLATLVLESPERWGGIRPLAGLATYPVLLPSGEVLRRPGYDEESRLVYAPTVDVGDIGETEDAAREALRWLWVELCHDFPFAGLGYPEPSAADPDGVLRFLRARECPSAWGVVAAILSMLARPAIAGDVPAVLFDASTPGSGKGLQIDIVATAVLGRSVGKLTWPSHGGPQAEHTIEQSLGGEARMGSPVVVWDEIVGPFGGPSINRVLTSGGRTRFRLLGQTQVIDLPWTAVMLGAGNNIAWRDNTHRRVLVSRLEPPTDAPEKWEGVRRHPDLIPWVSAHRGEILRAALTVLRAWVMAGRPDMGIRPWGGGYESWTMVARALRWAGGGDVLGCRVTAGEAVSEEQSQVMAIMVSMERIQPADGLAAGRLIDALFTPERVRGKGVDGEPLAPDGHEDARDAIGAATRTRPGQRPDPAALGRLFRTWRRRVVGGRVLDVVGTSHGSQRWAVRNVGSGNVGSGGNNGR